MDNTTSKNIQVRHPIKAVVLQVLVVPSTGDQIEAFSALSTNIATITTNRLNVSSRASVVESNCSTTTVLGTSHITQTGNWTWGSDAQARYFSNTGGRCSVRWDLSSFTADSKANEWNTLASNCGTYYINAQTGKSGGGGSVLLTIQIKDGMI